MPTWTVKADQRQADYDELVTQLELLGRSVEGLTVAILASQAFQQHPDRGGFRAFAPVATISHDRLRALEAVAEELISQFGWLIDLSREKT